MQIFAIVVSLALTVGAMALLVPAVRNMLAVIRSGQPAPGRTDNPVGRGVTMLKETFLHTRMLQWHWIGIMHWFVYAAFLFLSTAVLGAYFQLFDPEFAWPLVGHWYPFEWFSEFIGLLSTIGIVVLIVYRQLHHPKREGRSSRFYGSTMWQAYFVEYLALLEGAAILFIRGAEYNLGVVEGHDNATRAHFPLASFVGDALFPSSVHALENIIFFIAMFKIALAMVWLMVIARNITMGIAWHRFTAWFNIYFKRESDGGTALGAMKPLTSGGKAITLDDIDDLDEDSILGVGSIEDFSWKGILDFTTCTECGRCQSQCPAWNTEKPLSPKLLIMGLRDHAYAKAAEAAASSDSTSADGGGVAVADKSLIGSGMEGNWFYNPEGADYVIDEDVLWSCTSCGACVQQCPVDIEHVDHIMDMRRYQVLVESNFPAELNGLFKGLENKGNPWNMSSSARMDWAKGLEFDVPVVGEDLESLESVDWLFWVGCAGAYEDRAKKTTRAVAELLDMAGVSFGVLGNGETCTGDPARRAGNEFVFQGLAAQNVETFKEFKVKKVVSTCAHCFNTLKNEYKDFGIELEVVHHTQLLNRLVREGKLTPIKEGAGAAKRSITYHDPCYLGRHNDVYTPPRELLEILPGAEFKEMERNSEKSFCCGAGGARMWMEENVGERINLNRTKEAVGTGADQIAVGCPFCRVMLSDGLTAEQAGGNAREEVEVLDVAQMLLASVKGESATKVPVAAASGGTAKATAATDVATKAEPEAGDVTVTEDTVTETADAGPAAKASGGSSLFDTPAPEKAEPQKKAEPSSGGSLFDTPAPPAEKAEEKPAATPATAPDSGGSLFDLGEPEPTKAAEPAEPAATSDEAAAPAESAEPQADAAAEPDTEPRAAAKPAADLGSGGSLFDLATPEAEPKAAPAAKAEPEKKAEPAAPAVATVGSTGSLFDIAAPDPAPGAKAETAPQAAEPEDEPESESEPESEPEPETSDEAAAPATDTSDVPETTTKPEADVASSGPVSTPATSIPEGGSLFDLEAPAPSAPAAAPAAPAPKAAEPEAEATTEPAPEAEVEPEPTTSDEAAAPATDTSDVPETTTKPDAEDEPSAEATPAAPSSGTVSTPATSIPEGGSLFDIEAPTPVAATPKATAEPASEPETSLEAAAPTTESSDEPESTEAISAGAALSQAATFTPEGDDPETILDADDVPDAPAEAESEEKAPEPEPEAAPEPEPEADDAEEPETDTTSESDEEPKPVSTSAAHTPKTDVDINAADSLFDL